MLCFLSHPFIKRDIWKSNNKWGNMFGGLVVKHKLPFLYNFAFANFFLTLCFSDLSKVVFLQICCFYNTSPLFTSLSLAYSLLSQCLESTTWYTDTKMALCHSRQVKSPMICWCFLVLRSVSAWFNSSPFIILDL